MIAVAEVIPPVDPSRIALIRDVLRRFGEATIRVTGSSMLPSVWPGDELVIRGWLMRETRTGDIAVFTREGRLFAHRVVAREGPYLVTRGDSVPTRDEPVSEAELLGVAVSVVRGGQRQGLPAGLGISGSLVAALTCRSAFASRALQRGRMMLGRLRVSGSNFEPRRSTSEA